MYFVLDFMNVFAPAGATVATGIALLRGRAYVTRARLRYHGGPMRPGVAGLGVVLSIR